VDLDAQGIPHFDICENVAYDYLDINTIPTCLMRVKPG
jgi:hypothetical protein